MAPVSPSLESLGLAKPVRDKLAKLNVQTPFDLALHLPLRYIDRTRITPIAQASVGSTVQVEGVITTCEAVYRPRKALICVVEDDSQQLILRLLHFYPSHTKTLAAGRKVRLFGEIRHGPLGLEMVHPEYTFVDEAAALPATLTSLYPTTQGLSQHALRTATALALKKMPTTETLPEPVRTRFKLARLIDSLTYLHSPPLDADLSALNTRRHPAWRRLKFDELLAHQLSMRRHYAQRRSIAAPPLRPGRLTKQLAGALPFALTAAQQRAIGEITADLQQKYPTRRLLQGDVGSGKTLVAAFAAAQAIDGGYQAALMAPTEILAEQHFHKLAHLFEPFGVRIGWLTSALSAKTKATMSAAIASGEVQLAVGTHALFQDTVAFKQLGLVIVDEQHRFGVNQRIALRKKGVAPHQLMMSATPIPRTLAMSYYADLDISVIDELPPGRSPIQTKLVDAKRREEVTARIAQACRLGRQVYWVCPLIDESETLALKTALETREWLVAALPDLAVGLVHGRLPAAEKMAVMDRFVRGEVHLLVATTVIEVGVDVPNASLIVIEHAERLGLSQLHQLRGRVGRGATQSACILLYQRPLSPVARERLKVIYESSDGFEIARRDLALRGPGELLGARQSGVPLLRFADIENDADLIEEARNAADWLLRDYPDVAQAYLDRWFPQAAEMLTA